MRSQASCPRPPAVLGRAVPHPWPVRRAGALRVLGRDDEVDDVVQEVFLVAMADLDKLRNPLAVRGWLKTVTVRKAYRVLKQRGRRRLWAMLGFGSGADGVALDSTSYPLSTQGCNPEERVLWCASIACSTSYRRRSAWPGRCATSRASRSRRSPASVAVASPRPSVASRRRKPFLQGTLSDAWSVGRLPNAAHFASE